MAAPKTPPLYRWRARQRNGSWRRLSWPMSEADASQWAEMQSKWEERTVELERLEEQPPARDLGRTSDFQRNR